MFQPKFYILVLFLAVAVFTKANHPVDSMRLALDKEAFSIYLDQYIKEQEQSITDKEGLSFAYYFLGNHLLNNNNDSIAAKEIFLTGEKFAQEQNDTTQIIRFKRAFGTYFLYRNQFEESISYYIDGLKLAKATNNLRIAAILTTELARVYYILEDFETAIQYLEEGKSYALKAEDKTLEASILNNIGIIYKNRSEWDKALDYYKESVVLTKELKDSSGLAQTLNNIGSIYLNLNDYDLTYYYYNEALIHSPTNSNAVLLSNISMLMLETGKNIEEQIQILNEVYLINLQKGNLKRQLDILETLYLYYERSGNYEEAYHHLQNYIAVYQELLGETRVAETQKLRETFDAEQKEQEIELLKEKNYFEELSNQQNRALIFILVVLIIMIIAFAILWIKNNSNKQEKQRLHLEQQLLRSQMNPHFIFNSISNIQSFILEEENDLAIKYLGKFSKLARQTLENSSKKNVALEDELDTLINYLDLQKIRFENQFDYKINSNGLKNPILIPPMLIQPFVENAIEHGIKPLKEKGIVTIELKQKQSFLQCFIVDNGVGRKHKMYTSGKRSMSTAITQERIELLGKHLKEKPQFEIIDVKDVDGRAAGTKVIFDIPIKLDTK